MAYASSTDLTRLGLSSEGLSGIDAATISAMLVACSARVDDAIASGGLYSPPLSSYPASVTLTVCKLAQYELIGVDGYYPDEGTERVLLQRYEQAEKELSRLSSGGGLSGVADATPSDDDLDPAVDCDDERGWGIDVTADEDEDDGW